MARICQRCQHPNEDHAKFCLSCGAMLEVEVADQADPLIGKVIQGRYRPTRLVGEGGMGRVYEAEQKMGAATRKVAIKTLHPEFAQDPQIVARFNRECETVIDLHHPNTIQFYDFGQLDDATLFIAMEFIQGRAVAAELEKGPIDAARVDKILVQVCGSLNEAHQRGIVHRDLKPDNILLTDRGGQNDFVKVLDFGIAKKGDAEDESKAKLTKQGMVLGTPPYMSPEQFSGKALDARSDIYSMGIVAYEMLTGQLPFDAKTPWEWATKHLTAPPTPFEAHPRGAALPQFKKDAIMRAMSKSPDHRQADILMFMTEVTGQADAQQAWTNATSAAGMRPQTSPVPVPTGQQASFGSANPSQPTPPFQQTSPLPAGMGGGMGGMPTGQQSYGSTPTPAPYQNAPSNPGYNTGSGYQPAYNSGAMAAPAPASGGGFFKFLVAGVIGLFVVGALTVGVVILAFATGGDDDPPTTGVTTTPPPTTTGPVMRPIDPQVRTTPPPTTSVTPPPTTSVVPPPTTSIVPPPTTSVTPPPTTSVTPPPTTTPPSTTREPRVSAADEARGRALAVGGLSAIQRGDFANAIATLQEVQRVAGRGSSSARELRTAISTRGSREIGSQLARGNCPAAQALFRQLRTANAEREARSQFSDPRWCPAP